MGLTIEADPTPVTLDPARTALLLIDFQRDFLEAGGFGAALGNDVQRLGAAIAPARALLDAARQTGMLVIHTREGHRPDLSDCPPAKQARMPTHLKIGDPGPMGRILIRGEPGHDLIETLAAHPNEPIIDKPGKGAFHATDLDAILRNRGIDALIVGGVTTEVCVSTSVREANDRGYRCVVAADACASYFPDFHTSALAMIAAQGAIFGWVTDSHRILDALAGAPAP